MKFDCGLRGDGKINIWKWMRDPCAPNHVRDEYVYYRWVIVAVRDDFRTAKKWIKSRKFYDKTSR